MLTSFNSWLKLSESLSINNLGSLNVLPSNIAFLALSANYKVENVSLYASTDGEIQTISVILDEESRESLRSFVSLEFRKGICLRLESASAEMHWPRAQSELLMEVSS